MTMFKWVYSKVEINNVRPGYALKCGWREIADNVLRFSAAALQMIGFSFRLALFVRRTVAENRLLVVCIFLCGGANCINLNLKTIYYEKIFLEAVYNQML